ncbi:MAG: hypothetical protein IJ228_14095 [Succinivibrio sp.]|nr:hypothetical protein [Succinivibrio sp.]
MMAAVVLLIGCADPMDRLDAQGSQFAQIRTLFEQYFKGEEQSRFVAAIYENPAELRQYHHKARERDETPATRLERGRYLYAIKGSNFAALLNVGGYMDLPGHCDLFAAMDLDNNMKYLYPGHIYNDDQDYAGHCYEVMVLMQHYAASGGRHLDTREVNAQVRQIYAADRDWLERKIRTEGRKLTKEQKEALRQRPLEIRAMLTVPGLRVSRERLHQPKPRFTPSELAGAKSYGHSGYNPLLGNLVEVQTQITAVQGFMLRLEDWDEEEFVGDWFIAQ